MKQKSLFYKIYFSVIAVFLAVLIVGLLIFRNWLASYEAAQPEQIVDRFIETYVETGNLFSVRKDYNLKLSAYESEDGFKKAFKEVTKDKKLEVFTYSGSLGDNDRAYTLKADDKKIMNIFLKQDKEKGFNISSVELDKSLYKSVKITATSDADISVNGVKVKDSDRKNEELPDIKGDFFKGKNLVNKQIIKLDNLLSTPKEVTAKSGKKDLEVKNEDGEYTVIQEFDEKESLGKFAGDASKACAAYMQNDSSLYNVRKYVDTTTEFYTNIRTSLVIFVIDHNGYEIKDLNVTDYHKYSDGLYSCRVRLTNELKLGNQRYQDHFDKYVYLRSDGNSYKVLDMQNTVTEDE